MNTISYVTVTAEQDAPRLYINGESQEGLAYITYLTERNRYADFASAGYRLFSVPVFFGSNHLNEHSGLNVFTKGVFDTDTPDFAGFDADIGRILKACPDAYILPRVNVSLSRSWELTHSDELCDPSPDGCPGRASFASDLWAAEVKRELTLLLDHIAGSEYAPRIAGYQIAGGNTEEWLPLDPHGISGQRAREKYESYLKNHPCEESEETFYRFYSELVAERICEFAAWVKQITKRTVVVGSFYGYTLECTEHTSGHHALRTLLECEDIDFICSPVSYSMTRALGRDHPYMVPFASIRHHGKLYFSENDTRTHLSRPVNDMPWYNAPIWFGPDKGASCEGIKLHAARALINRHAAWWFDMWGGWFADNEYMALMKRLRELFVESQALPMGSVTEIAVFVDEEAYACLPDTSVSHPVCYQIREVLGIMGAPYDLYLTSDAPAVISKYKAIIALTPIRSSSNDRLAALVREMGKPYLEIHEENAHISSTDLRAFLSKTLVHIWCDRDAVIYANESYVFLHAVENGTHTLRTPDNRVLQDVFSGEIPGSGIPCKKGHSYLFRSLFRFPCSPPLTPSRFYAIIDSEPHIPKRRLP